MSNTSNNNITSREQFANMIKARMFELQQELKKTNRPEERARVKEAIMNNCSWLISLGYTVDKSILGEV